MEMPTAEDVAGWVRTAGNLSTAELLGRLEYPGDLDWMIVLMELFQRGAQDQVNLRYPAFKKETLALYETYCATKNLTIAN
jgi:hypothetical protein